MPNSPRKRSTTVPTVTPAAPVVPVVTPALINPSIERERKLHELKPKIAALPQDQQEVLNDILSLIKEA